MNFPEVSELTYGYNARQLYENYFIIYFWENNANIIYDWIPDGTYELLSINSYMSIKNGTKAWISLNSLNSDGTFYNHSKVNDDLVTKTYDQFHNFRGCFINDTSGIRFAADANDDVTNYCDLSLILREITLYYPPEIKSKCNFLDWLRGECVHGIT